MPARKPAPDGCKGVRNGELEAIDIKVTVVARSSYAGHPAENGECLERTPEILTFGNALRSEPQGLGLTADGNRE